MRHLCALILVATVLKGIAWSVLVPPLHAPDEPSHVEYAQSIGRLWSMAHDNPPIALEVVRLMEAAQVDPSRRTPLDVSQPDHVRHLMDALNDPAVKNTNVFGVGTPMLRQFMVSHPPLYFTLAALVQRPLESRTVAARLLAARWLSVAIGVLAVWLAWRLGEEFWPGSLGDRAALALLVSFHPMLTFTTSTVASEILNGALYTASLLIAVRACRSGLAVRGESPASTETGDAPGPPPHRAQDARRGPRSQGATSEHIPPYVSEEQRTEAAGSPTRVSQRVGVQEGCSAGRMPSEFHHGLLTWRRAIALGVIVGAGLLTKASFVGIVPVLAAAVAIQAARGTLRVSTLGRWMAAAGIAAAMSGWWYLDIAATQGGSVIDAFRTGPVSSGLTVAEYLRSYPWYTEYRTVLEMYWGNFGWLDTPLPGPLIRVLKYLTGAALLSAMAQLIWSRKIDLAPWALGGIAIVPLVVFYQYVDYRFRAEGAFPYFLQGRYYLPAIAAEMALIQLGLVGWLRGRWRHRVRLAMIASVVALNVYSLLWVIAARYYPSDTLWSAIREAAMFQPVGPAFILVSVLLFVTSAAAAVIATARVDARHPPEQGPAPLR